MANNTTINTGSGGDTIRDVDRAGVKTPVSLIDKGAAAGTESLVSDTNPLPVVVRTSGGTEIEPLHEGTDITGAALPAGGASGRGWLSAIWKALTDRLPTALVGGRLDVNVGNTPAVTVSGAVEVTNDVGNPLPISDGGGSLTVDGTVAVTGTVTADTELPAAVALADAAANPTVPTVGVALLVFNGATWDRLRAASSRKDQNAVPIGTIATVWTPASGKKVRLMGGCISVSAPGSVLFEDNTAGTTVFRTPKMAADTPYNFDLGQGALLSLADHVLKATLSQAGNLTGTLYGTEE